jgi:hypothetical protein
MRPAGAGKTGAVVKLLGALASASARVGVVTQTNAQAFDLVKRAAEAYPRHTVGFMPAIGVILPTETALLKNVRIVEPTSIGTADVIVATADKWAYSREKVLTVGRPDAGIVDEAYQMTSAKLLRIADLFPTLDMVGDPGQLDPFSTIDKERWVGLPQNPVLNSVDALLAHHPAIPRRALRVSRRLDWRGTPAVREAFYPELHFGPAAEEGSRELCLGPGGARLGRSVWNQASRAGWAYLELPERPTLQVDDEAIEALVELVHDLFAMAPVVVDERTGPAGTPLSRGRVAVGVVHRSQRAAAQIALQRRGLGDVVVDTANRLQGREFDVVLAIHPLSGRTDASAFHLDAGRLCVLASRHRQCCVFVGRAGAARLLNDYPPPGNAVLRMHKDPELDGWEAHARFLEHLAAVRVARGVPFRVLADRQQPGGREGGAGAFSTDGPQLAGH